MSDDSAQPEPAPEGAHCAEHPDREAFVTCPRCGSYCCLACWHGAANRCHTCLLRDPLPPVPWAANDRAWPLRLLATLADALRPARTAPAFARGPWPRAISFALLTAVPISMLSGIIPFTFRLGFGPAFAVRYLGGDPGPLDLTIDLAQAAGMGLLIGAVKLALLAVPYLSLTRAYGHTDNPSEPARQVMLYRAWLLPMGGHAGLILGILVWSLPISGDADPGENLRLLLEVLSLLPLMLLLWSMTSTARVAGVGPLASIVVVLVPFLVMMFAEPLFLGAISPWLPDSAAIEEAARSTQ